MKTILVDAVYCFVSPKGEIFEEMHTLLESYPNKKILVTGANDQQYKTFGLDKMPYEVFTLKHAPEKTDPQYFQTLLDQYGLSKEEAIYFEHSAEAVESAQSVGIISFHYDESKKDLESLEDFLNNHI